MNWCKYNKNSESEKKKKILRKLDFIWQRVCVVAAAVSYDTVTTFQNKILLFKTHEEEKTILPRNL